MERTRELKWVLFNSFYYLEAPVIDSLIAQGASVYSIGPCILSHHLNDGVQAGITVNLWAEEVECLEWLDKQSPKSVVYVSFGSLAIMKQRELEEIALGLEATQKPFLWVLRGDLMDGSSAKLPPGFMEATKDRAYFVPWCPQMQVLSHPSIACFVTHYVWKIGLALNKNNNGIAEKKEIEMGVKKVFEDDEMKARFFKLSKEAKDAVASETGSSYANFQEFVKAMKEKNSDK
ncbi:7-deoxyloganetin glucosyltransferase-like [Cryptomeria japonica]|uniref:7-deoxyloganetin glucosyltransferase-like n=1 Tax=Cryptomeria japonica TaxID=3369 RepID=UPI0025ABB330|nr:7-deoxyloganetin glucosyltransferase-like [Cryptomeria japonica]